MSTTRRAWLDYLRAERGASPHTLLAYEGDLQGLADYLGPQAIPPESAQLRDLRGWLATSGAGGRLSPATSARRIAAVRNFFDWLVRTGRRADNPAARLSTPRVPEKTPRFLDVDEAAAVVENPTQDGWYHLRNRALLELLYGSGVRIGEAVALDVLDVDLGERMVTVRQGKGRKDRVVPFGPPAARALATWIRELGGEGALGAPDRP